MFSEYASIIISLLHRITAKVVTQLYWFETLYFVKIISYFNTLLSQVIEKNGKLLYEIDTGEEKKFVSPEDVARLIFSKMKGIEQRKRSF